MFLKPSLSLCCEVWYPVKIHALLVIDLACSKNDFLKWNLYILKWRIFKYKTKPFETVC